MNKNEDKKRHRANHTHTHLISIETLIICFIQFFLDSFLSRYLLFFIMFCLAVSDIHSMFSIFKVNVGSYSHFKCLNEKRNKYSVVFFPTLYKISIYKSAKYLLLCEWAKWVLWYWLFEKPRKTNGTEKNKKQKQL